MCNKTSSTYGTAFKIIKEKYLKNTDLIHSVLETSNTADTFIEIQKSLLQQHFGQNRPTHIHSFTNIDAQSILTDNSHIIHLKELKHCIYQQYDKKAPGYDRVDARVIKNLMTEFPHLLLELYNKCLALGHFPEPGKKGVLIFFRKKNKDPTKHSSYRPITLLPMLGKVLERLVKTRTLTYLESSSLVSNNQFGFKEGRGTVDALRSLEAKIKENLITNKYCGIISFDIEGAFDSIDWELISNIIDDSPLPTYLKYLLKNYISHRFIGINNYTFIEWFNTFRGCSQGSCLGPLLWLLVANYIINLYNIHDDEIIVYADDFMIIFEANTRKELELQANPKITIFELICNELGLRISKTKAMLFGRNTLNKKRR